MAVLITHSIRHSYNTLKYVFEDTVHSDLKTNQRVLACTGFNIKMLHDSKGHLTTEQSAAYLQQQFHNVLKRAYNPKRRYQAQSIIISFSSDEFDTSDLERQSQQALQLAQRYVHKYFGDAQSVIAVQADGAGGKLHAHIILNPIKPSGKTIATNRFNINHLRSTFDKNMYNSFKQVTGREWKDPIHQQLQRRDTNSLTTRSEWQQYLKELINQVKIEADNLRNFLQRLSHHGVTVTERNHRQSWTYHQQIMIKGKTKELKVRDFYQRVDKDSGEVKSTRGLGQDFTKSALEHYYQLVKEEQNEKSRKHEEEQLEKVKTMAADARERTRHQQRAIRFTKRQLKAAEAEEQKQRDGHQTGQINKQHRQSKRLEELSRQKRREKAARRLAEAKSRFQSTTAGPNL